MSASPADFLEESDAAQIERLAAAEIVGKMRNAEVLNRTLPNLQRARLAAVFERLGNEFHAAATLLKRERPDPDPPRFLLLGVESPEFDERYLKPAQKAGFHE